MSGKDGHWLNYIGGEWVDEEDSISITDPATGAKVGTIARANAQTVDRAVAAARACADSGVLTDCRPSLRADWLRAIAAAIPALAEEGARLATAENGKTVRDSQDEFAEAARYFNYYAGMADKIEGRSIPLGADYVDFTIHEPHGVSAQVVPWNFPVSLCARSLAPALAASNAVVVKTPELCPLAPTLIARACEIAGLPAGAVNIICGYGHDAGAALVAHPGIDQIVFTGSVPTGQSILRAAAERAIPCVMELGGKSAAVVFADADIKALMENVRWGIFFNAGQVCSAMSRMLVERSRYDEVVDEIAKLARSLDIGAGADNKDLTPLASETQRRRVLDMCEQARKDGARLVTGGGIPAGLDGHFVEPTLFADVTPDMAIFREEVFGPVLAIMPFDDEDEAWALANDSDYGLVAGVFTKDLGRSLRAAKALKAGQVFVNEWYAGGIETPFGGFKMSGYGREKGLEALFGYVRTKNVAIRLGSASD